jgi:hypothetical protein
LKRAFKKKLNKKEQNKTMLIKEKLIAVRSGRKLERTYSTEMSYCNIFFTHYSMYRIFPNL